MKKVLILIAALLLQVGCADKPREASEIKLYRQIVPGLPVAPGKRLGGVYAVKLIYSDDSNFVIMKRRFLEGLWWLTWIGVAGVLGGLLARYYKVPWSSDVIGISVLMASLGVLGALFFDWIVALLIITAVGAGLYFLYVIYRKHKDEKFKKSVVSTFQKVKHLNWTEGKALIESEDIPDWVHDEVKVIKGKL